jgi:membrane associated rhomboid family serine protease
MVITLGIVAVTAIVSLYGFSDQVLFDRCKFTPYDIRHSNQWYRFFSYGLFHAGWLHLIINMMVLYSFGPVVEKAYRYYFHGQYILYYLLLYIGTLLVSVLPAYRKHQNDVFYHAVGASGAISAIILVAILLNPLQKVYFFFLPIGIPGPVFGLLYIGYEAYMSRRGRDNIGHDAHLWGAIFGLVYTIALKPATVMGFLQMLGWR